MTSDSRTPRARIAGSSRRLRKSGRDVDVAHAEPIGEAPVRRAASHVNAAREVEVMLAREHEAQPGQRLPTPAPRRARRMRAEPNVDRQCELLAQALGELLDDIGGVTGLP